LEGVLFDYWHTGWHMWWMGAGWLIGLVLVGLFLWIVVRSTVQPPAESPESILKRRYAQGEVNTEEYNRRLTELRK
jgi:uncharacterized membrane protein